MIEKETHKSKICNRVKKIMCDGRAPYLSAKLMNQGTTQQCKILSNRLREFHLLAPSGNRYELHSAS